VKRYSSGMYVWLTFAVAAHLEPEILVADVAYREGRSLMFVSHQMAAIQTLCTRCIFLHQGSVFCSGEMSDVINSYLVLGASSTGRSDIFSLSRSGSGTALFSAVYAADQQNIETSTFQLGNPLQFCFEIYSDQAIENLSIGFSIHDQSGQSIAVVYSESDNRMLSLIGALVSKKSHGKCRCSALGAWAI